MKKCPDLNPAPYRYILSSRWLGQGKADRRMSPCGQNDGRRTGGRSQASWRKWVIDKGTTANAAIGSRKYWDTSGRSTLEEHCWVPKGIKTLRPKKSWPWFRRIRDKNWIDDGRKYRYQCGCQKINPSMLFANTGITVELKLGSNLLSGLISRSVIILRRYRWTRINYLQDVFLNQVRKEHIPVTIYLTNGFQLKGLVKGFDNFTVVLDTDGKQQLVYKHAISTISPMKLVNFIFNDNRE